MVESLANLFSGQVIAMMIVGIILGIVIGALPGLTATMGVALLVPMTFWMPPFAAIMMLLGIYIGAMYGGALSAILIRMPGTPAAAATTFDGYPLAQQGKAGLAIGISCITGVIGGIFSTFVLIIAAPFVARFALKFGPAEYFALAVFGLSIIASLSGQSLAKGLFTGACGLFLATVGMDPITAVPRFTFGLQPLLEGLPLIPILIGVFALGEVFHQTTLRGETEISFMEMGRILPNRNEWRQILPATLLACLSGTLIGALPGVGGDIAAFVAYDHAKKLSRNPGQFGKGALDGLAAAECANNSVTGGAMIPLLTLGIPGDSVTAVLLGAFMIHGIRPGPELFQKQGEFVTAMFVGLIVANLLVLPIGLMGAKIFAQVIYIPKHFLLPLIIIFSIIGAYAINNNLFDIVVMFIFGLIGWIMRQFNFPVAPLVLGLILGRMIEENLRRALILSEGQFTIFVTHPIAFLLLLGMIVSVTLGIWQQYQGLRRFRPNFEEMANFPRKTQCDT